MDTTLDLSVALRVSGSGCGAVRGIQAVQQDLSKAAGEAATLLRGGLRQPLHPNGRPFPKH